MSFLKQSLLIFSIVMMVVLMGCGKASQLASVPASEEISTKNNGDADPYLEEQVVETDEFQAIHNH